MRRRTLDRSHHGWRAALRTNANRRRPPPITGPSLLLTGHQGTVSLPDEPDYQCRHRPSPPLECPPSLFAPRSRREPAADSPNRCSTQCRHLCGSFSRTTNRKLTAGTDRPSGPRSLQSCAVARNCGGPILTSSMSSAADGDQRLLRLHHAMRPISRDPRRSGFRLGASDRASVRPRLGRLRYPALRHCKSPSRRPCGVSLGRLYRRRRPRHCDR